MLKKSTNFLLLMVVMITTIKVSAQNTHWCATDEVTNAALQNSATARAEQNQLEAFTQQYVQNFQPSYFRSTGTAVYVIPVVFHIIHNWGPENISDAQVYDAIRILNRDYNGQRTDTANIIPDFKALNADVQIEFRLAHKDPNGNCTNGIDRQQSLLTYDAGDASKLNPWPYNKYLNIWTVSYFGSSHASAAAYAYKPGTAPPGKDGIIALHNYVGSIGTGSSTGQYTLTHEIGHWLNLNHTWGGTNQPGVACGDDNVTDTPVTKGYTNCPSPSNADVCTPGVIENYQNYMDYSYCYYMFTLGQKARMWAALNSGAGLRNQVHTATNLANTGTDGGTYICSPSASFSPVQKVICEGGTVSFIDASLNTDTVGTTYLWTFNGGTPSTSTDKDPAGIVYNTAGIYDVTLTVTTSAGFDTYTGIESVVVRPQQVSNFVPYSEGFENVMFPSVDWIVDNENGNAWELNSIAAHSGFNSIRINNFSGNVAGTRDVFITPGFNLTNTTQTQFTYWLAFAVKSNGSSDVLKVYASNNCGQLWNLRTTKTGSQLATVANAVMSDFIPNASQWRQETVSLTSGQYSTKPNVSLKFEYTHDLGNNIYIDDINLTGVVGISDYAVSASDVNIVPNPASDKSSINFELLQPENVLITVTDMLGKEVHRIVENRLDAGEYQYDVNTKWAKGVYTVRIAAGSQIISKKLVVE
ncbi:MAG TPA: M43 family zinc metalloprotease [Bacteroidia bacterium]|jgi:PKD repeat protein|nr:M43 family zinc metalloprotease [Bacteroidia bacterium]HMU20249.1 M43 family zinc metalloprotease [Bacteroidia bacterium]